MSADLRRHAWDEQRLQTDGMDEAVFNLDEELQQDGRSSTLRPTPTTYPSTENGEEIVCATFATVSTGTASRYILVFSIWSAIDSLVMVLLGS